jgi:RNA polymerase sigma-70 factor (ECF subfamily)
MAPFHLRDRALVKKLLKGDEEAFSAFFERHFSGLYRFALSRLRDAEAAEEVAQATLCKAVRALATYRGEASLFAWLCTFCRHEIHAHLKAAERRPEPIGFVDDLPEIRAVLESAGVDMPLGSPEMDLRRKELARWVQTALDHLPPHYGQALEWKYLEELPVKEIARRLDLAPKAAESLLGRARAAFRESFDLLRTPELLPKKGGAR